MGYLSSIQNKLREAKPQLVSKYHVKTLGLFGSIVRNDFTNENDIDIIADFTQLVGVEFIDWANDLEKMLNRKVDLVSRDRIKPAFLKEIQPEIIYA
jgi:predicted nucleotidyltransferase